MLWYLFCSLLVLSPVFLIALLYFSVRYGDRLEARRIATGTRQDPQPQVEATSSGDLRATVAGLEAQFLLAPGRAIREAEERLRLPRHAEEGIAESRSLTPDKLRLAFEDLIRRIEQTERTRS